MLLSEDDRLLPRSSGTMTKYVAGSNSRPGPTSQDTSCDRPAKAIGKRTALLRPAVARLVCRVRQSPAPQQCVALQPLVPQLEDVAGQAGSLAHRHRNRSAVPGAAWPA